MGSQYHTVIRLIDVGSSPCTRGCLACSCRCKRVQKSTFIPLMLFMMWWPIRKCSALFFLESVQTGLSCFSVFCSLVRPFFAVSYIAQLGLAKTRGAPL